MAAWFKASGDNEFRSQPWRLPPRSSWPLDTRILRDLALLIYQGAFRTKQRGG